MDAPSNPKLDPALLLLRELDNLLAQLCAMELELKRAQTAADDKMARLQKQIEELEGARLSNEEQIGWLQHQVSAQERALMGRQEAVTAVELALHARIQSLQQDLARSRSGLEEREVAAENARKNAAAQRQDLESRLKVQDEELLAAQSDARESEQRLGAKIHDLQLHLADRQLLVDSRATEIVDVKAEVSRLMKRLAEFEGIGAKAGFGVNQTEVSQADAPAKGTELDRQENAMKIDDANQPPLHSAAANEQSRAPQSATEPSLREEIARLMREAQEKNQILLDRNDELVRVKSELDRLHERMNEIESASSRAESAYGGEAERTRTEFQAQLALLQAELSQREWALEEHQAEARGREQDLRREIDSLRRQLVESNAVKKHEEHDFVFGEPRSKLAQEQRFELTGDADATERGPNGFANQRRWHSGFAWKRRWRS